MIQHLLKTRDGLAQTRLPRLLPITIVAMAAVLVVKSGAVVQAAANVATSGEAATPVAGSPPTSQLQHSGPAAAAPTEPPAKPASNIKAEAKAETPISGANGQARSELPAVSTQAGKPLSESELHLLTDLRQRRAELDRREAEISAREATFAAIDARIDARVRELTALQRKLEALERDRNERDEANWRGLVKLYETMKPRDAALIFNDLDLPVLLQVVDRMKEAKAAVIVAGMQPERARLLTTELSQMRLKSNSLDTPGKSPADGAMPAGPQKNSLKP
jgi:flagellar motility protein MotE (MotC chaperone)